MSQVKEMSAVVRWGSPSSTRVNTSAVPTKCVAGETHLLRMQTQRRFAICRKVKMWQTTSEFGRVRREEGKKDALSQTACLSGREDGDG